jgi:hypothetical protein
MNKRTTDSLVAASTQTTQDSHTTRASNIDRRLSSRYYHSMMSYISGGHCVAEVMQVGAGTASKRAGYSAHSSTRRLRTSQVNRSSEHRQLHVLESCRAGQPPAKLLSHSCTCAGHAEASLLRAASQCMQPCLKRVGIKQLGPQHWGHSIGATALSPFPGSCTPCPVLVTAVRGGICGHSATAQSRDAMYSGGCHARAVLTAEAVEQPSLWTSTVDSTLVHNVNDCAHKGRWLGPCKLASTRGASAVAAAAAAAAAAPAASHSIDGGAEGAWNLLCSPTEWEQSSFTPQDANLLIWDLGRARAEAWSTGPGTVGHS